MGKRGASRPSTGNLLLAYPWLPDPNFFRSVVLLCRVEAEQVFGLVLNHKLPLSVSDAIGAPIDWDAPLYRGGPVEENTLHVLHRCASLDPAGEEVLPGIYWGGDFEQVRAALDEGRADSADFRFFAGYSGWSAGQLEEELKDESWYVAPGNAETVFCEDPEQQWREAMRSLGRNSHYQVVSNFPVNPRMN